MKSKAKSILKYVGATIGLTSGVAGVLLAFYPDALRVDKDKIPIFSKPAHESNDLQDLLAFISRNEGEIVRLETDICGEGYELPFSVEMGDGNGSVTIYSAWAEPGDKCLLGPEINSGSIHSAVISCGGEIRKIHGGSWSKHSDCKDTNHAVFFDGLYSIPETQFCSFQAGISECFIHPATAEAILDAGIK